MTIRLRDTYRNLSPQALEDKAYELAFSYQRWSKSCAQSVVAAISQITEIDSCLVKAATSFVGGQVSQAVGTCGALIGGTIVLDCFFGRPVENISPNSSPPESLQRLMDAQEIAYQLYTRYVSEYGTILCPEIQTQLVGRYYYLWDPDEMAEFERLGGFRSKCSHVAGKAARWVIQILVDRALGKPS
jgi:C_GCAxxG_C_C family probable redox protein